MLVSVEIGDVWAPWMPPAGQNGQNRLATCAAVDGMHLSPLGDSRHDGCVGDGDVWVVGGWHGSSPTNSSSRHNTRRYYASHSSRSVAVHCFRSGLRAVPSQILRFQPDPLASKETEATHPTWTGARAWRPPLDVIARSRVGVSSELHMHQSSFV